ncbi:MAG: hypothetical protein QM669_08545 [Siphonobacter sp.]
MIIAAIYFKTVLTVIYIGITAWLLYRYLRTDFRGLNTPQKTNTLILYILLGVVAGTRICYLENIETDVDTSTWLSSVISLNYYPDKFWKWLNYTDSRPLTVLPLWMVTWLGIPANYLVAEWIGVLLWLGSILITYRTLCLFISSNGALLLSWSLCMFIATTGHSDHTAYNSEHISIFLITVATYWYVKAEKSGDITLLKTFELGLVLGSLVYAKFQNVPMGLVIASFSLLLFLRQHQWKHMVWLVIGSVLPTALVNIVYLIHGKVNDFWTNYFWNYLLYSYTTQFQAMPMSERFAPARAVRFLLLSEQSHFYVMTLLSLAVVSIAGVWTTHSSQFARTNRWFALGMLVATLYAILQSGNDFLHYTLYIFIPLVYWLAAFEAGMSPHIQGVLWATLLVFNSYQVYINCSTNGSSYMYNKQNRPADIKIVKSIKAHSTAADNIVIWGWVDRWYYYSNRACGYRMPHSHQLFMKSSLYKARMGNFLEDLEENRPTLFIDAATPEWVFIEGLGKPHEHYPEVKTYIQHKYTLVDTISNVRIYKRIVSWRVYSFRVY